MLLCRGDPAVRGVSPPHHKPLDGGGVAASRPFTTPLLTVAFPLSCLFTDSTNTPITSIRSWWNPGLLGKVHSRFTLETSLIPGLL